MALKLAIVVLGLVALIGMIARSLRPRVDRPRPKPVEAARRCKVCDAYVIGGARGPCARADCPDRSAAA